MTETVASMPSTYVAQDMSIVELNFAYESGNSETLRFPMSLFERFMGVLPSLLRRLGVKR